MIRIEKDHKFRTKPEWGTCLVRASANVDTGKEPHDHGFQYVDDLEFEIYPEHSDQTVDVFILDNDDQEGVLLELKHLIFKAKFE